MLLADCANVIVPEATEQAMRYYNSGNFLWILSQLLDLFIPFAILFTGLSSKLASLSRTRVWFFSVALYLILYSAISQLISLPLSFYSGFTRMHAYGLSNQTLTRWFSNWGLESLLTIGALVAFIWIFYLLIRKSPRRWWFYSSLVAIAISFFLMFIQPVWIDPLFNKFGPMKNKKLEEQILTLASRAHIAGARVYEVDKSQDTKTVNAYVIGMGSSARIVLWDTTLEKLNPSQILFVMGHEMGHYVLHHIWWGFLYYSLLSFFLFYFTYKSAGYLLHRYSRRFGFNSLSSIASLPLLLLLFGFFSLLTTPLNNAFTRTIEHHADIFGLEITQDNQAAGTAFVALQLQNLANPRPGPVYTFWRCTHPPLGERVDFCNSYCPWVKGEPLKYGKYFE